MFKHLHLWRNRAYLLLWSGQMVSQLGTTVSELAFPLLVLTLTGSAGLAGLAGALRALPYFLLGLPAGALIDRWDRKRVMLICDGLRALSLLSIPLALALGHLTPWQLFLNALLEGTLYVFFDLAEASALPQVVPAEQLETASTQAAFSGGLLNLIGPALGGLLYGLGRAVPFLVDACSYLASLLSLFFIQVSFQGAREQPVARESLRAAIAAGLRWLWRERDIRALAILTGGVNLIFPDSSALLVIVLARQFKASAAQIGLIFALGSVGYLAGSLLYAPLQRWLGPRGIAVGSCWLFALFWLLYALTSNLLILAGVTLLLALIDPIYDIMQFSYRAARIPEQLRGRVHGAYRLLALATPPLGLALTGLLLEKAGPLPTVLLLEICLLALALTATLLRRQIKRKV